MLSASRSNTVSNENDQSEDNFHKLHKSKRKMELKKFLIIKIVFIFRRKLTNIYMHIIYNFKNSSCDLNLFFKSNNYFYLDLSVVSFDLALCLFIGVAQICYFYGQTP